MRESLETMLRRIVAGLDGEERLNPRIESFVDYKRKFVVLKPAVKVTVELTQGRVVTIDVTDYFKGVIK